MARAPGRLRAPGGKRASPPEAMTCRGRRCAAAMKRTNAGGPGPWPVARRQPGRPGALQARSRSAEAGSSPIAAHVLSRAPPPASRGFKRPGGRRAAHPREARAAADGAPEELADVRPAGPETAALRGPWQARNRGRGGSTPPTSAGVPALDEAPLWRAGCPAPPSLAPGRIKPLGRRSAAR